MAIRPFAKSDGRMAVPACAVEVKICKVHVESSLVAAPHRVDVTAWRPLFMSFRELFVRGDRVGPSRLAKGDENAYAPWTRRGVSALAARALGALAERKYGVAESKDEA